MLLLATNCSLSQIQSEFSAWDILESGDGPQSKSMWVPQYKKVLVSCSSQYLHIALSALQTVCLALC